MSPAAILADDLTGAMDAGLQVRGAGGRVLVLIRPECGGSVDRFDVNYKIYDAVVLDTESRNQRPETARQLVKAALEIIDSAGLDLIYKKIDSTMRGNIGWELMELDPEIPVVLCPALPCVGRTVGDGILKVDGVPVAETEMSRDSLSPVRHSRVGEILHEQVSLRIVELSLEILQGTEKPLAIPSVQADRPGPIVILADAQTEADLEAIAGISVTANTTEPNPHEKAPAGGVVFAGSAGLLRPVWERHTQRSDREAHDEAGKVRGQSESTAPVLFLCGSPSEVTAGQINEHLWEFPETAMLTLNLESCVSPDGIKRHTAEAADEAASCLRAGRDVILRSTGLSRDELARRFPENPDVSSTRPKPSLKELSERILVCLELICRTVLSQTAVSGLYLTGGDTALRACRAVDAQGIEICGSVEPYVPFGRLYGGVLDGLPVVTKAGGFGGKTVMAAAAACLRSIANPA
jgi:D-threonate/D-erythronate kinase